MDTPTTAVETANAAAKTLSGWDNVIAGNGITISITGMTIVFAGLIVISTIIAALPKILEKIENRKNKRAETDIALRPVIDPPENDEVMMALAAVVHHELEALNSDDQKITLAIGGFGASHWSMQSRMRSMPTREGK